MRCMCVGGLWVLAGCVQFCQLSFKYLFTVVGDDSPERPSVQQRHLRMGAGKSSRAVAMQKGSYVLYSLLSCTACMWVGDVECDVWFCQLSFHYFCF